MGSNRCRTIILIDQPTTNDLLGGAHEATAQSILDVVENQPGGFTIGLEGAWGSGKSTVIALLKKKFECQENSDDICLFEFDAWEHQGDYLRRSFLERLIERFTELKWVDGQHWEHEVGKLSGRITETETKITNKLTCFGKTLITLLSFAPISLLLLSEGLQRGVVLSRSHGTVLNLYFIFGVLLFILPWLFSSLILIAKAKKWINILKFFQITSDDADPWEIITQKFEPKSHVLSIKTPVPTSVEFEFYFNKLLECALKDDNRRKLIVIFDNLDRIPQAEAISILSTLQIFSRCGSASHQNCDQSHDHYKRFWVVVPYAPTEIARLWDGERKSNLQPDRKTEAQSPQSEGLAEAMINKRYQLRFQIPPLLLSNWQAYLLQLLQSAFPDHAEQDEEELLSVCKVYYQKMITEQSESPTPRNLISFVNRISTFHLRWSYKCEEDDKIPLSHMAYYACLCTKKSVDEICYELVRGDIPESNFKYSLGGIEIQNNLIRLVFGVDLNIAQQLLLERPITDAVNGGDIPQRKQLEQLYEAYPQGFFAVIETLITKWALMRPQTFFQSAIVLEPFLEKLPSSRRESLYNEYATGLLRSAPWIPINQTTIIGTAKIIELCKKHNLIPEVTRRFTEAIRETLNHPENHDQIDSTLALTIDLFKNVTRVNPSVTISSIGLIGKPAGLIEAFVAIYMYDIEKQFWNYFNYENRLADCMNELYVMVANGNFSERHINAIRFLLESNPTVEWSDLISNIVKRLETSDPYPFVDLLECLWVLKDDQFFAEESSSKNNFINIVIYSLFQMAYNKGDAISMAWCIFFHITFVTPPQNAWSNSGNLKEYIQNPSRDEVLVDKFIDCMNSTTVEKLLLLAQSNSKYEAWCIYILKKAIATQQWDLFTVSLIIQSWLQLKRLLDVTELETLVNAFVTSKDIQTQLVANDFSMDCITLYLLVFKCSENITGDFVNWIQSGLNQIPQNAWMDAFNQNNDLMFLVFTMLDKEVSPNLGERYCSVLDEIGRDMMKQETDSPNIRPEESAKLINALDDTRKKWLCNRLLSYLAITEDNNVNPAFFDYFSLAISIPESIIEIDKTGVILEKFLSNRSVAGLKWLKKMISQYSKLKSHYRKLTKKGFSDKFTQALKVEDDATPILKEIEILFQSPSRKLK